MQHSIRVLPSLYRLQTPDNETPNTQVKISCTACQEDVLASM